jgi:ribosome-associated protein
VTNLSLANHPIEERVRLAVAAALDKKATNLDVLAVGELTSIADSIVDRLREEMGVKPLLIEGTTPGRWVLLDFGDFIVHIFTEEVRRFYGLERLWGDAPNVTAEYTGEVEPRAFKKTS